MIHRLKLSPNPKVIPRKILEKQTDSSTVEEEIMQTTEDDADLRPQESEDNNKNLDIPNTDIINVPNDDHNGLIMMPKR